MIKIKRLISWILLLAVAACAKPVVTPTVVPSATRELPTPIIHVTEQVDVLPVAESFLNAWKDEAYEAMYNQLTSLTKDAVPFETFEKIHRDSAIAMTLQEMEYQILSTLVNPASAQVNYRVTYHTSLLGEITRESVMNLASANGTWQVQWEEGMIMPELHGGNSLEFKYKIPARGNIYDRFGYSLVAEDDAVALGIVPGWIGDGEAGGMVSLLAKLTNLTADEIRAKYEYASPDWYIPIGDISAQQAADNQRALNSYGGIVMNSFRSRYYYDGGIAPHVIGYVQSIPVEELETYQRLGYRGDEKVGTSGIEQWGEEYLAGVRGGALYVKDPQGQVVTMIASSDSQAASSIYTTIDSELQYDLQESMGDFLGAIVVVERDSGRVLAMVSNPSFDPNLFEPTNYNWGYELGTVLNDPTLPLYNRAAQGVYPLGSVFKIVTMTAALQTGVFFPDSEYYCGSTWEELEGTVLYDWTYEKELPASGKLTLQGGLMRSCNPWFWHIGYSLWNEGYTTSIADEAIAYGFGANTGIEIGDEDGTLEYPDTLNQNVQLAIGQGTMQVSPLQVAMMVAAVGNGGTLYQPTVIDKITPVDGDPTYTFTPKVVRELSVTPENLSAIQEAMVSVVDNSRGTAYKFLGSMTVNVAGKTGTAQNPLGDPHAWFAGYTNNNNSDKPDIAVAIVLENAGEGSDLAAPLFRRAVSLYFSDTYGILMPWEASPYIQKSPTPIVTPTPEE